MVLRKDDGVGLYNSQAGKAYGQILYIRHMKAFRRLKSKANHVDMGKPESLQCIIISVNH